MLEDTYSKLKNIAITVILSAAVGMAAFRCVELYRASAPTIKRAPLSASSEATYPETEIKQAPLSSFPEAIYPETEKLHYTTQPNDLWDTQNRNRVLEVTSERITFISSKDNSINGNPTRGFLRKVSGCIRTKVKLSSHNV